jgi:hypothetical protein
MLGKIVGIIALFLSVITAIGLVTSFLPAMHYAMKGDVANTTDAAANATADYIIDEVYWMLIGSIAITIAGLFGLGALARKIFG